MHFGAQEPPLRYFTPKEANAHLPKVRDLLAQAAAHADRMRELLKRIEQTSSQPERTAMLKEVERLREDALGRIQQIRESGVEVKGLETGLLDFPALRNGEYVYLCWKVGEPGIDWWHPLHTGYAGRQRISNEPGVNWEWRN